MSLIAAGATATVAAGAGAGAAGAGAAAGAAGAGAAGAGGLASGVAGAGKMAGLMKSIGGLSKKLKGDGGTALAAGKGLLNMLQGKRALKKADSAMPGREDPEERAALQYTKRQRRAFQTGTAMQAQRASLLQGQTSMANKLVTAGGGTRGLNMMQGMFNKAMLGTAQYGQDKALQYNQQAQTQLKNITDRKLQLGMLKYTELQKRAAEKLKSGKEAGNLALSKAIGVGEGTAATSSTPNPAAKAVTGGTAAVANAATGTTPTTPTD